MIDYGADVPVADGRLDHEELRAAATPHEGPFVVEDENSAAAMCHVSGTTGNPEGVVYPHRSAETTR